MFNDDFQSQYLILSFSWIINSTFPFQYFMLVCEIINFIWEEYRQLNLLFSGFITKRNVNKGLSRYIKLV